MSAERPSLSRSAVARLLAITSGDPGCDAVFAALDEYVDAVLRGDDVEARFAQLRRHLEQCGACREDAEGLLAALRTLQPPTRRP